MIAEIEKPIQSVFSLKNFLLVVICSGSWVSGKLNFSRSIQCLRKINPIHSKEQYKTRMKPDHRETGNNQALNDSDLKTLVPPS